MKLKPYSKYDCRSCNKYVKWTGAYNNPKDTDSNCPNCGAELVENTEENKVYRVSWEMANEAIHPDFNRDGIPNDRRWKLTSKDYRNEYSARQHHEGLLQLASKGELIRNVKIEASALTKWEPLG